MSVPLIESTSAEAVKTEKNGVLTVLAKAVISEEKHIFGISVVKHTLVGLFLSEQLPVPIWLFRTSVHSASACI